MLSDFGVPPLWEIHGNLHLSGRCAYGLKFNGPSLAIDTGDSSGLVASDTAAGHSAVILEIGISQEFKKEFLKHPTTFPSSQPIDSRVLVSRC